MTVLGQQVLGGEPALPFTDDDLKFVTEYAAIDCRMGPDSLGEASALVVTWGVYRVRKPAPPPIPGFMWEVYDRRTMAILGHRSRAQCAASHGRGE